MPVTVLRVTKRNHDLVEVSGEFKTEAEAEEFVEEAHELDRFDDYEYLIEKPPSLDH